MSKSDILFPSNGLWITSKEEFVDEKGVRRRPGDLWLVTGPGEYWKPIQAVIDSRVRAVLAVESLGIYVFRPGLFFGVLFGVLFFVYLINSYILL